MRRSLTLATLCAGMFLVLLDVTVVNVALPAVAADLTAGAAAQQWIVDGYAVALAGALLTAGALGDRFGHRRLVLLGFLGFGLGSAGCGLAPDVGWLVAARAVQGVGAAALLPTTLALVTALYPERAARARALGTWAAITSLALPAGPMLGGLLVTVAGWRWVFLLNVPVVALAAVAVLLLVRRSPAGGQAVDLPGLVGSAVALVGLVYAVIEVGHHGVGIEAVVAAAVSVLAGAGLVRWERRARAPLLPPELIGKRRFAAALVVALLMNTAMNGTLYVVTLYLQVVQGRTPLAAGVALLPLFLPLVLLGPVAGRLTARFGPRPPMICAAAVGAPSAAMLAADDKLLLVALAGLGIAAGLLTAAVMAAALQAAPAGRAGIASGLVTAARQAGTAIGVAVFGAVAGAPTDTAGFVTGLHTVAWTGTAIWLATAVVAGRVDNDVLADVSAHKQP
ncbi:MFS transporter [Pseudonocardia sp. TRM90224]|uniref:MFS transporter n=1 Tax=Pseudonocardia sp. TRM90224 TaxID=2812678 RepID=UPI001E324228|nr:MFS transporter [Pseudonocardia sp. TRM90224]